MNPSTFNEDSIDEHPSKPIKENSIAAFCEYVKQNNCKNIIVMTGAGISTSAGIPDFRTPGTGLYDNLQEFDLPYPEAIFTLEFFKQNPKPFYVLAKELYPSLFKPTRSHNFIKLLADKNMLLRNYTQNIDMLERLAGIDDELLVEAHGSFHTSKCVGAQVQDEDEESEGCGETFEAKNVKETILNGDIPKCHKCGGLVKPDIVFFGEALPKRFFDLFPDDFEKCDALIVMGTSLQVAPFCNLIHHVKSHVPRLLINMEDTGTFDSENSRDYFYLGKCDQGADEFIKLMDFEMEELQRKIANL